MTSIFTRIVQGEIPSAKVYEDELTYAFLDISPASRGHTLVVSKEELSGLLDLSPDLVAAVARAVQVVARAVVAVTGADGFNVIQNNGPAAGQTVFHYHVHIIPRWEGDGAVHLWRPGATPDDLRDLAARVTARLGG